jgi:proteasome lid subunit RPN8/RPN11
MIRLVLGPVQRAQIEQAARAALPSECCGLIEGIRDADAIHVSHVHATRNIAAQCDRFEIDPAEHFALLRAARAARREIVGCYHSHPNGESALSERDHKGAGEKGFVWLVVALGKDSPCEIRGYLDDGAGFAPLELVSPAQA